MNIEEYRQNNNTLFDLKMPIVIPVNLNINKYGLKNNNTYNLLNYMYFRYVK